MNECQADFVIRGEPEIALFDFIESNFKDTHIKGVYGSGAITNGVAVVDDLEALPILDYAMIPFDNYLAYGINNYQNGAIIEFSRGCKYNCIFCFKQLFRNRYRTRPVSKVIKEIELLKEKCGYEYFYFIDELFNYDNPQLRLFLRELKDLNIHFGCQCRPDIMNEDLLKEMKNAGCIMIEYGVETFDPKISSGLHKNIDLNKLKYIIEKTSESDIITKGFVLYGFPDENLQSLETTRKVLWNLNNKIFVGGGFVVPYPTTELFEQIYGTRIEIGKSEWDLCEKAIGRISLANRFVIALYRNIIYAQNRVKHIFKKL